MINPLPRQELLPKRPYFMFLSDKEYKVIMTRLANIEKADRVGCKRNYLTNQVGLIRLVLKKAFRRGNSKQI